MSAWAPPVIAFAVVGAVFWASCVLPLSVCRWRERRRQQPHVRRPVRSRLPPGTITTLPCGCAWHHDGLGQWVPCAGHADPLSRQLLESL